MSLNSISADSILRSHGVKTDSVASDIRKLAAELKMTLDNCIDENVMYEEVASAIKNSAFVFISSPYSASITLHTMRPSIYNEVGINGGYVDLVDAYNYGSKIGGNPYFYNENGGFYLRDKKGFAIHKAGHFLEKAAEQFMARHPECTVRVGR